MTISTTSNEVVAQGNGLTTSFSFSFQVPLASELYVYYTDATGTQTLLSQTQYSVTGIGSAVGGSVTYPLVGSPIATGTSLTIQRIVAYQQLTDLVNQSGYYPNVVENALDYLTMQTQQLAQEAALSLQVPFSASTPSLVYPSAMGRANKLAGFDSNGNAMAYPISSSVGAGNLTPEGPFLSGTGFTPGVTTQLTLSQAYGTPANLQVHFDGIYQGTDQYTLNGTLLTFNSPIPVGTNVVYVVGGTTLSVGVPANGSVGTAQLQDGAVTAGKIAAGAVDVTKLSGRIIGDAQIAWSGVLARVVTSITALRTLSKTVYTNAFVTGYYATNDGGGGAYYLDASDTTSADNGGTIIVATDGGRWKLIHRGTVYAEQFGAKGDGATDDSTAILAALGAGSVNTVMLSYKAYRVSQTIAVPAGKCLHGEFAAAGGGSVADSAPLIFADLSVTPILSATGGSVTESPSLKNITVSRAAGTIPSGSIGVSLTNSNNVMPVQDVGSIRSDITWSVGGGATTSLGIHLLRCWSGQATSYHLRISNVVESTYTECRFGRNGGADYACTAFVNVNGATVDTVRFVACQFNQSGNNAGLVLYFTGYASNPNGIFIFTACHAETWGTAVVSADAGSTAIKRMKFSACQFDGTGAFYSGAAANIVELTMTGNTCVGGVTLTLDQQTDSIITGNKIDGAIIINQGSQVVTGNIFSGSVTLEGAAVKSVFVGNSCGSLTNTMSGTSVVANNG